MDETTQEIVNNYYTNNRRYRRSLITLLIVGAVCAIGTLGVGLYIINQVNHRTQAIQSQMTCIGAYFNQTDRQNIKIPSLDTCNIERVK